mmetsp:Transcript_6562/g.17832  ORF Transcript_6562/g.17832 Transcript_6562/m.17832 type:complete len:212 (-) Transcript_6562:1305-1940(-)
MRLASFIPLVFALAVPTVAFVPTQQRRIHASHLQSTAVDYITSVEEALTETDQLQEWTDACQALVDGTELSLEQIQDAYASALGWKSWAMTKSKIARRYIKPKAPSKEDMAQSIAWLQSGPLQLDASQLGESILSNPTAYLLSPDESYQSAMKVAPKKYRDEEAFLGFLQQYPAALGNYYNCVDDGCNSECGNCWVAFMNRCKNDASHELW